MLKNILICLTLTVLIFVGLSIYFLDAERLGALGSILAGAGGILAVIWFSAGLRYQSIQLEEQKNQFAAQFLYLKETSRRDALLLAKGILDKAEEKAIESMGSIVRLDELFSSYIDFPELKSILESNNPNQVLTAYRKWIKKEGAAIALLTGIKSAAEVYLKSIGVAGIDYTKDPADFYFVYKSHFSSQPFFNTFTGTAGMLSEFMVRLAPARNAANIAFFAATVKAIKSEIVDMDKLKAQISKHIADGYPLPEIAKSI